MNLWVKIPTVLQIKSDPSFKQQVLKSSNLYQVGPSDSSDLSRINKCSISSLSELFPQITCREHFATCPQRSKNRRDKVWTMFVEHLEPQTRTNSLALRDTCRRRTAEFLAASQEPLRSKNARWSEPSGEEPVPSAGGSVLLFDRTEWRTVRRKTWPR